MDPQAEELELIDTDPPEGDEGSAADPPGDQVEGDPTDTEGGTTDDAETVITIGGEPVEEDTDDTLDGDGKPAATWLQELRASNKEKARVLRAKERELREKDAEIARLKGSPATPQAVTVGEKPTFEGCEFDPEKFETALTAWNARKSEVDAQQRAQAATREQEQKQWQARIGAVDAAATKMGLRDRTEAAEAFEDSLSILQKGIILLGPDDAKTSAGLRHAIGSNPKLAKELAAITDPVKFAFKIANLTRDMKMSTKKAAPPPERTVSGNVPGAVSGTTGDQKLARLQADADKTGDRTKVAAYLREKQKSR